MPKDANQDWRELRDDCLKELVEQKRAIRPLTHNQRIYFKAIEQSVITFCVGPAGSGKTYIPCGLAVKYLAEGRISKVILTRPLVTCSGNGGRDRVGFLPGDLLAKVGPHMRPMVDVLLAFMGKGELEKKMAAGIIEIVPMDYMRGLSIDNALIIADEMQNAMKDQWKMLLTRLGKDTRLVASGDDTQSDLPGGENDWMYEVIQRLQKEKDVSSVILTDDDIVRSDIVRRIARRLANW